MLRISKISFPGLGIDWFEVNSVAFSIGKMEIAWYAIIISLGIVAAVLYTMFRAKQVGITTDDILDFALIVVPSGVIGARLYYVLTKLDQYDSFAEVINIRNGGLAIYGGIIAGGIAVYCVSKFKKVPFLVIADCCTPGIILAQSIGRWGNFMNGEAFGYATEIFCRMGLENALTGRAVEYVHPTFLYESLWNIIGFILVNLLLYKRRQYDGQVFLSIFGWYGLGRFFIEALRQDSLYTKIFGLSFRTSQVLAAIIFLTTATIITVLAIKKVKKPLFVKISTKDKD